MKNFGVIILFIMSLTVFMVTLYIAFLEPFVSSIQKSAAIGSVEKSPIRLEKPRYELKRHACADYVCDPQ